MKISITKIILFILVLFIITVFFLALNVDNKYSNEKIVGRKIDNIEIKFLSSDEVLKNENLTKEKYHLFNIWASWCLPCKKEHPTLMSLSEERNLKIIGINFKDKNLNATDFLKKMGNPYDISLSDTDGTSSILFGVFGVPESILVDKEHVIVKKFIGPLSNEDYENIIKVINEN